MNNEMKTEVNEWKSLKKKTDETEKSSKHYSNPLR